MKKRLIVLAVVFFALTAACWLWPVQETSQAERRALAQKPELSAEAVRNGSFMNDFEDYTLDQFPLRDAFRRLKAVAEYGLFQKKDNNGFYMKDGYAAQILYPLNENSVVHATDKFREIYESFLSESEGHIFVAVVPDKGYYMASENGYPALDYEQMFEMVASQMNYATFVDLTGALELSDYYKTDSHWRQEYLAPAASVLGEAMGLENLRLLKGAEEPTDLVSLSQLDGLPAMNHMKLVTATEAFHGVYYGQSALPLPTESLNYLTWDGMEDYEVYNYETGQEVEVYQQDKVTSRDPYDVFLGGAAALITVENPEAVAAGNDRELILFRDSFGSSIAPLFLADYSKVTLVDIRYMQSSLLDQFIEFDGQDVLFLYGTTLLNDSFTLK